MKAIRAILLILLFPIALPIFIVVGAFCGILEMLETIWCVIVIYFRRIR